MLNLNKTNLIQTFTLKQPVPYHFESLKRVAHLNGEALRKASVLIGFVERPSGIHVLLTKRAMHLKHHPGQVSFPGGKHEESDRSIIETAIREANEEVGIGTSQIEVFGTLPELNTISRFSVTPTLAFIDPGYQLKVDKNEVEEAFEVPIKVIFDSKNLISQTFSVNNERHRVFCIAYENHYIWGMTAQIIHAMQKHLFH